MLWRESWQILRQRFDKPQIVGYTSRNVTPTVAIFPIGTDFRNYRSQLRWRESRYSPLRTRPRQVFAPGCAVESTRSYGPLLGTDAKAAINPALTGLALLAPARMLVFGDSDELGKS